MAGAPQLPIIMTAAGAVPTPPQTLRDALVAQILLTDPGFTANLPASLVEDVVSTGVGLMVVMDQARVDSINNVTPYGANEFVLGEQGAIYGVQQGADTNTAVYVTFTGTVGFLIPQGFKVSDGTYGYQVIDGGAVIPSGGTSAPVYCLATVPGAWAVPAGTVTTLASSIPAGVTLTVTNPQDGTPSQGSQSTGDYRAQVQQAGMATSQGAEAYLKTQLANVPGVPSRLVSVQQVSGAGWRVLVGGTGDPYQIANAIFQSGIFIPFLQPSVITASAITKANPAQVTTAIAHEFITGQANVHIAGATGMTAINGGPYTVTVIDDFNFTLNGVDSTGYGVYTGNGVVTPNSRNITVDINSYPDTYAVQFVNPPPQTVAVELTWNTTSTTAVPSAAVAQLGTPAIVAYVNSVATGQPINLFELDAVFQAAVLPLIPTPNLSRLVWTITIDGTIVAPTSGTGLVQGDTQSFLQTSAPSIDIVQG